MIRCCRWKRCQSGDPAGPAAVGRSSFRPPQVSAVGERTLPLVRLGDQVVLRLSGSILGDQIVIGLSHPAPPLISPRTGSANPEYPFLELRPAPFDRVHVLCLHFRYRGIHPPTQKTSGVRQRGYRRQSPTPIPPGGRMPASPKPDQAGPKLTSPTGVTNGQTPDIDPRSQSGAYLTTAQGLRLPDTDHSLKAGERGPALLRTSICGRRSPTSTTSASRAGRARPGRRGARRLRVLRHRRVGDQGRIPGREGHGRPRSSPGSRPCWARAARPTPSGTPEASR